MELFFLKVFAVLRPIMFIESPFQVLGLNMFEAAAILFSLFLLGALVSRLAVSKDVRISPTDLLILSYVVWCITAYLVYIEMSDLRELGKFVLPFFTYIVAKNIITDRAQYKKLVFLMILGFIIPVVASTVLIATGGGIDRVNFWTGLPRYLGVYSGPHNMAHNMTFLLMLLCVYLVLSLDEHRKIVVGRGIKALFAGLAVLAIYCLYYSGVRTSMVGLAVFLVVLLFFFSKRLLIFCGIAGLIVTVLFSLQLKQHLYYEAVMFERTGQASTEELASGRPRLWMQNLDEFLRLPIDRQLAGVGIGNSVENAGSDLQEIVESHNDLLEVLIQTGVVGFILFLAINVALLRAILRLPAHDKYLFLAIFLAVVVMNFASNSYVSRFGLAQMYYFVMAFAELSRARAVDVQRSKFAVSELPGAYR